MTDKGFQFSPGDRVVVGLGCIDMEGKEWPPTKMVGAHMSLEYGVILDEGPAEFDLHPDCRSIAMVVVVAKDAEGNELWRHFLKPDVIQPGQYLAGQIASFGRT